MRYKYYILYVGSPKYNKIHRRSVRRCRRYLTRRDNFTKRYLHINGWKEFLKNKSMTYALIPHPLYNGRRKIGMRHLNKVNKKRVIRGQLKLLRQ